LFCFSAVSKTPFKSRFQVKLRKFKLCRSTRIHRGGSIIRNSIVQFFLWLNYAP
jgi:hypothetical protein